MSRHWILVSLLGLAVLAGVVITVHRLVVPDRLNVVLITVESARADAINPTDTPYVWQLITQSGHRFTQHHAVSGWTAANIVSILTGLSPIEHAVHTRGESLATGWPTPLETLSRQGWLVAGLQPFMTVDVFKNLGLDVEPGQDPLYWLASRAVDRKPFVLWYHYLHTHLPYAPSDTYMPAWRDLLDGDDPEAAARVGHVLRDPVIPADVVRFKPADRPAVEALYRAGFREFDDWFRTVWSMLQRSGLRRNTIVILTADHGEELLERGLVGHASTTRKAQLYREITHLPLAIWHPPGHQGSNVTDVPTDHLDIMPTVLDALGLEAEMALHGRVMSGPMPERPWMAVTSMAGYAEPHPDQLAHKLLARQEGQWKLIVEQDGDRFVPVGMFDLTADPDETEDRSAAEPAVYQRLKAGLLAAIAVSRRPAESARVRSVVGPRPEWIYPPRSGTYGYDDAQGRFWLEWSGPEAGHYLLQYQAGDGLFRIDGELEVTGNRKDFGRIEPRYWQTWLTAYSPYRVRVGYDADNPNWSEWLELHAE